jgi:hypothetical protein
MPGGATAARTTFGASIAHIATVTGTNFKNLKIITSITLAPTNKRSAHFQIDYYLKQSHLSSVKAKALQTGSVATSILD